MSTSASKIDRTNSSSVYPVPVIKIALAAGAFASLVVIKNMWDYSHSHLPEKITKKESYKNTEKDVVKDRIKKSLVGNRVKEKIHKDKIDKNTLSKVASKTNASIVHISGNCALLASSVLYNLEHGEIAISARNTFPIYRGFESPDVAEMIFGKDLIEVSRDPLLSIEATHDEILSQHKKTQERFYLISSEGYQLPVIGDTGHYFNAVVLFDDQQQPYVQFVDAWRTWNPTPSVEDVASRYKKAEFTIYSPPKRYHPPKRPAIMPPRAVSSDKIIPQSPSVPDSPTTSIPESPVPQSSISDKTQSF